MSDKKTFVTFGILDHDGKRYMPGETVDLTDEQAAPFSYMLAEQTAAPENDQEPPPAPESNETQADAPVQDENGQETAPAASDDSTPDQVVSQEPAPAPTQEAEAAPAKAKGKK